MLSERAATTCNQDPRLPLSRFASLSRRPLRVAVAAIGLLLAASGTAAQQTTNLRHANTHASRAQRFAAQRRTANSTNPAFALQHAHAQQAAMLAKPRGASLTASWQPLGPTSIVSATYGNLSGRVTALALDPNDMTGNTLYVGTTGGGVWKSTNAEGALSAVAFTPLTDTLPVFAAGTSTIPSLSIGALAVQPSVNPVLLAGTGDANDASDSYYGEGLLRSGDGGLTWTLIGESHDGANGNHSFAGLSVAGIAFSTATPSLVVAAFSTSLEGSLVDATNSFSVPGLYYSTDAGQTWQMASVYDGAQVVQQPMALTTAGSGNAATSVVWDALRQRFFAAVRAHGYYSSADGVTWTRLAAQPGAGLTTAKCPVGSNGQGSATCPLFRGALAVQAVSGDLYALTVDANDVDQGLWQDLCNATANNCATPSPVFANRLDNGALEVGSGSTAITQGSYDLALAAQPASGGGTVLYAGTVDLYRCAMSAGNSTCALRNTTNALNGCNAPAGVAPAQHALAALSASAPLLFLGNDGGLWRSLDGVAETGSACAASDASHFNNLNAALGSLAEVTGFAQHPTNANTLLAGLGANGSAATSVASSLAAWPQMSAGEGGFPAIDPNATNDWYLAIGAGVNVKQCTLGSSCAAANFVSPATIGEAQVDYDASVLDAPWLLDPAQTTSLIAATCRVWRGPAGSSATWSAANAISPVFNGSAAPCTASGPLVRALAAGGPATTSTNAQNSGSQVIYAGLAGASDGGSTLGGHVFVTMRADLANASTAWTDAALSPVTNDSTGFNPAGFDISSIAVDPHDATGATVYATVMGFGEPHLYRSTDFGGHWLNVSINLPDAPANAVLVDPNDANTVYVATDAGVYVTTAITTCASANCWNALGTGLPNAPVVALSAAAAMATGDGRLGMLRAATYGRGIWQQPLLTAISPAQPAITVSATSFNFAVQQVATQSAAQTLTVTSSGNAPVTFGALVVSGDFTETDTCAHQTVAVNATCTVQIAFAPTATGARTGQLVIYANVSGGQANVALSGTGTAPAAIVLTPLSLTFAATIVNQTTAGQTISIANTGGTTSTLQAPVIGGSNAADFAVSANTCGSTLGPSTACAVSITFTPSTTGSRSAQLSVTDSDGTQTAQLSGTGNAPATDTLSATSLPFAQQQIGTSSAAQQVTLTNSGDAALTLIAASVAGGDFSAINACGNSLAGHSTCAISVIFTPTATGALAATLSVSDEFRTQTVALSGVGAAPPGVSLSPASLSFPAIGVGLSSAAQTLTLTNNGGLPLSISSIAGSQGFTIATSTCGATLAVNAACAVQIVFTPAAAGPAAGTITITDNAPTPTQTATLSGTGIDFALVATGATTATLSSGGSAIYMLQLSSLAGLSGNVALACAGTPAHATCTVAPPTAQLGGTTNLVVTVLTGTTAQLRPMFPFGGSIVVFALLLPLALLRRRRTPRALLAGAAVLLIAASVTGCGAGRLIPDAGGTTTNTPTPSGTYNLSVSANAAGLTKNVGLTLVVQ
jgi:hypothetical protein